MNVPTGPMSLRDALALALLHSPNLAAFAWEVRAREAQALQAGRPQNPVLGVLAEDLAASGLGGAATLSVVQPQTTVQMSQVIELGGKRAARQGLATLDRDMAAWDYEGARIDVLTQVSQAFVDVLTAQSALASANETRRVVEEVLASVTARVTAGSVSPIEQTRAEVALASSRLTVERATRALDASRRHLASLWGAEEAPFQSAIGELAVEVSLPRFEDLQARVTGNPDLARWNSELSRRKAEVSLEQARRTPDVTVTAGYRRYTQIASNALLIGGTVSLPFLDRNKDAIEAANSRLAKSYEERRGAEARVTSALAKSYQALADAFDEVTALRTVIMPGARQAFDAISEGYRLGRFGYLEVLEAQRTLVGASGEYVQALGEYHKAIAAVERLVGAPLAAAPQP